MKIHIKNIWHSYMGDKDGGDVCPVCTEVEGQRSPMYEIGNFLVRHNLAINPKNLEQSWEYVCGTNKELKAELDRASSAAKLDNESALAIYDKYLNDDINGRIGKIFEEAVEHIHNSSMIIKAGNDNAIKHETQLIEQADDIRGGKTSLEHSIEKLLGLSRLMVESTRENREQISETNKKLATLQRELEVARSEADHDKLTRLPNRRKFDRVLDAALQRHKDQQQPFVLAFVDIDHFKRINDTFGHDCGDRVLRMIADQLSELSDNRCHISRYGGEEFAILFEDSELDPVFRKLDQCRAALAEKSLVDVGSGKPMGRITFSAGMTQCLNSDAKTSVLRKADLALYSAKSEGRNMICVYSPDVDSDEQAMG
ncbi:GGDEF domain-containing protein [Parasphingorhabdus sp.]|uniref:GGDEF domain-containing protein n=1 Tax=Parasphingorhabdus sp. TaxID=2709688 RepID=UPI00300189D7